MPEQLEEVSLVLTCPEGTDTVAGANRDGAFKLTWTGPSDTTYQLLETQGHRTRTLFEGESHGSTVTGRPAGDYQYTVGIVQGPYKDTWSPPCDVKVRPYPLGMALSFFCVGAVVTLATIIVVLRGHRAHKRGEIG